MIQPSFSLIFCCPGKKYSYSFRLALNLHSSSVFSPPGKVTPANFPFSHISSASFEVEETKRKRRLLEFSLRIALEKRISIHQLFFQKEIDCGMYLKQNISVMLIAEKMVLNLIEYI